MKVCIQVIDAEKENVPPAIFLYKLCMNLKSEAEKKNPD